MEAGTWRDRSGRACVLAALFLGSLATASPVSAQLLYSFESGLQGFVPTSSYGFTGSDLISVTQSTTGATVGTHSMAVKRGVLDSNGFSWDVGIPAVPAGANFDAIRNAAANRTEYALDFDVTLTAASFANVTSIPPFFAIMMSSNGSAAGENNFDQVTTLAPVGSASSNLMNADPGNPAAGLPKLGTHHYSVPLAGSVAEGSTGLYLVPNSTYYQLNIGSNLTASLFSAPPGEGAIYYVDNVRFRKLPDLVPDLLFSWETPNNPATPSVNEQFEGWTEGFHTGHTHSITTTGHTQGASALQIHREHEGSNFKWGSQFVLLSDTNPDPQVQVIDPVIQARINDLTSRIMSAERIAMDVTFDPTTFDGSPNTTRFGIHFSDTAHFFQAEFGNINVLSYTGPTTLTIELPLSAFATSEASGSLSLLETGFVENTAFFRMGISTNTDGLLVNNISTPMDFQIDNLRLINEVFPLDGDYNDDGTVDTADYVVWQKYAGTSVPLPNDPDGGEIDSRQYATWKGNFGTSPGGGASGFVPEPSAALLCLSAAVGGLLMARRRA